MSGDADRERLAELMDESRAEQGLIWEQVAARGKISIALLRRIRKGGSLTEDSKIAIERGLDWTRGSVNEVLAGGTYSYGFVEPVKARQPLDPLTSSPQEIAEFLAEVRAKQGRAAFEELFQLTLEINEEAHDRTPNVKQTDASDKQ